MLHYCLVLLLLSLIAPLTSPIYTLSLHDALPISLRGRSQVAMADPGIGLDLVDIDRLERALERRPRLAERLFTALELDYARSEEHTSELQSLRHLVCRLLLEKKKKTK